MRRAFPPSRLLPHLALSALLVASPSLPADDDDAKPASSATPAPQAGSGFAVGLSQQRQQQSGLKTQALAAASSQIENLAYARVVDISPLLDLRARFRSAQSEQAIAEAALQVAQKNHDRLAKLHTESIVPTRELILAESQLAADQARYAAAQRHSREIREEAMQAWGPEVFKQAVEAESHWFARLLSHAEVLILVALPANQSLPKQAHEVGIAPSGNPGKRRTARLIAPAPKTEESTQGETWFFAADAAGLRTGMRLDAWIPQSGATTRGVLIPLSAIVWRDGQPWVFVRTGADRFVRRSVGVHQEQGEGWFVAEGFAPGEEAVSVGGQMLLSEEQRHTAPQDGDAD